MKDNSSIIDGLEDKLAKEVNLPDLTEEDANGIGYTLSYILTAYFSSIGRETGKKTWSVDDMYPSEIIRTANKLTLIGNIYWLSGGGECRYYQADIATKTSPILYSIKLKNNRYKQILYVGKTETGWIENSS